VSLSHRPRGPRYSFVEDRRLSAPLSDGPPAPRRLEQPSPRTSPISDAPLSPLGHRLAGSRTDGKLARRPSCDERLALTRATETVTLPHLAELQERRSGRLPPCRDRPEFPPVAVPHVPPGLEASCNPRTVLASRPPPCASARRSESPWASAAPSIRLAVPRASRRAMRRTSFCHLTSTYEHPCLAGSRVGRTLARPPSEIPSASRQNESLWWVPRGPSSGFHRVGRCRPVAMRENRTSDTPVASCPEPVELALLTLSNRPPRPH
jgi:hypothetical protein